MAKSPYNSRWQKARATFLANHPLCVVCARQGQVVPATIVDHIKPHKGNQQLFWDTDNWQALCKPCHDGYKARLERSGHEIGCDANGWPIDQAHHWRKR